MYIPLRPIVDASSSSSLAWAARQMDEEGGFFAGGTQAALLYSCSVFSMTEV